MACIPYYGHSMAVDPWGRILTELTGEACERVVTSIWTRQPELASFRCCKAAVRNFIGNKGVSFREAAPSAQLRFLCFRFSPVKTGKTRKKI